MEQVNLVDAASGACTEKRDVILASIERKLRAVKAAAHRGKSEVSDQTLRDASVDEGSETLVRGRYLRAV